MWWRCVCPCPCPCLCPSPCLCYCLCLCLCPLPLSLSLSLFLFLSLSLSLSPSLPLPLSVSLFRDRVSCEVPSSEEALEAALAARQASSEESTALAAETWHDKVRAGCLLVHSGVWRNGANGSREMGESSHGWMEMRRRLPACAFDKRECNTSESSKRRATCERDVSATCCIETC